MLHSIFSLSLASASPAIISADITGKWNFEVVFADDRKGTPAFTFKQEGEKLTGTYKGGLGEAAVTGTIKGEDVNFSFKVSQMDKEITVSFTGKVEDASNMTGTVKATDLLPPGKWTARKQ
jgi:hypothetical protein